LAAREYYVFQDYALEAHWVGVYVSFDMKHK